MPWWGWVILGVAGWVAALIILIAMVRAGAIEDRKKGR